MYTYMSQTLLLLSQSCVVAVDLVKHPPSPESKKMGEQKTYNSQDSHVVTHHTTDWPACGLSTAERTGSPALHTLWSYVLGNMFKIFM
ncbi:hypothetical protein N7510_010163 [Penicillium lagena]|uniref:uncharacterized protein n=1 Tax=Penicillium lagena TaxID=94218 RepID=UPI002541D9F5|nr:uncharacterized protein N7510_010163 [Penicillium lagena]KAJ5605009.1 hypothetical protein N7510_010163 [Penicillium lagena]